MPIGRIIRWIIFQFFDAFSEPCIRIVVVLRDARTEHINEGKTLVLQTLFYQVHKMFGLSAETTSDEGCPRSQGESYRIDRLFDAAVGHRLRLHSFTAGRRSLTGRQAVSLVVHRDVQQVNTRKPDYRFGNCLYSGPKKAHTENNHLEHTAPASGRRIHRGRDRRDQMKYCRGDCCPDAIPARCGLHVPVFCRACCFS